jgi:lipid A 3-O-deacylase
MDGRLAIAFWLMSLSVDHVDMGEFGMTRAPAEKRVVLSVAQLMRAGRFLDSTEFRLSYNFNSEFWKFSPVVEASVTTRGALWVGAGFRQQIDVKMGDLNGFVGFTFLPGFYAHGNDIDLGFPLEFSSGAEVGLKLPHKFQLSIAYNHRSNAGLGAINPGVETLYLRLSKDL